MPDNDLTPEERARLSALVKEAVKDRTMFDFSEQALKRAVPPRKRRPPRQRDARKAARKGDA